MYFVFSIYKVSIFYKKLIKIIKLLEHVNLKCVAIKITIYNLFANSNIEI